MILREYLLIKSRAKNRYSSYGSYSRKNTGANPVGTDLVMTWIKVGLLQNVVRWTVLQNMKAIGYFHDDVDTTDEDNEAYVRGLIMKYGSRRFFCILEGYFKSDCN